MASSLWHQIIIAFPDWACAEHTAVTQVAPLLTTAETNELITAWFFVRKRPCWRVRYLPADNTSGAQTYLHTALGELRRARRITQAANVVYEPETHAFGGPEAMGAAHQLWHLDSRHLLAYLAATVGEPDVRRRRELSILLGSTMLRAAGLDWYEQGDVWARVADHRDPPDHLSTDNLRILQTGVRRLMSVETACPALTGAFFAEATGWAAAFAVAGRELAHLNSEGLLHRGLRDVLAHHIIFASNRLGLPTTTQAVLAATAKTVVFGCAPAALYSPLATMSPRTESTDTHHPSAIVGKQ